MNPADPVPNPEYERMVKAGEGWDPFAHMENALKRVTVGPPSVIGSILCPGCKKITAVRWCGKTADDLYQVTCQECGHVRYL